MANQKYTSADQTIEENELSSRIAALLSDQNARTKDFSDVTGNLLKEINHDLSDLERSSKKADKEIDKLQDKLASEMQEAALSYLDDGE